MSKSKRKLSAAQHDDLLLELRARFEKNMNRHKGIEWSKVQQSWMRRQAQKNCGRSMKWKEPAVNRMLLVMIKRRVNTFFMIVQQKVLKAAEVFVTIMKHWSQGKNINRKIAPLDMAADMGIEILTEEQYRELQKLGKFDTKTSSWIKTPADIRKLGGAIFGDCRYGQVFVYHNGAESYYAARAFRGSLRV